MKDLKKIVWLASYPKSGNTWFRTFLTNLLSGADSPADINNLYPATIASSRLLFDEVAGIPSSDLTHDETALLRPDVYRYLAETTHEVIYHKIHDAWIVLPNGKPLIPRDVTRAALYFIRNPLDVVISFAHHSSTTIDKTIDMMNNPDYTFCSRKTKLHNQMRQRLLTWSMHAESWIDLSNLPVMVIRYEDMLQDSFNTFKAAVDFIGIKTNHEKIRKALEFSSFGNMQEQEKEKGFREKSAKAKSFFRKGIAGDWRNTLSGKQIEAIVTHHTDMMERFGYLPLK